MTSEGSQKIDWASYARVYDLLAENNPAYQAIVAKCLESAVRWNLPAGTRIVDLGGGTGNFSIPLARCLNRCEILHVDANGTMNELAAEKARNAGLTNHRTITEEAENVDFPADSVGAVITVHALYAFSNPDSILGKIHRWLTLGGRSFACDIGRPMNMTGWMLYLFREAWRRRGLAHACRLIGQGRVIRQQNRLASRLHGTGGFWRHNGQDFQKAFERAGFETDETLSCYRGYSDLFIGHKRAFQRS